MSFFDGLKHWLGDAYNDITGTPDQPHQSAPQNTPQAPAQNTPSFAAPTPTQDTPSFVTGLTPPTNNHRS